MTTKTFSLGRRSFTGAARWLFVAVCWLYAAGVAAQVFAIGMVLLAGQGTWLELHRALGHGLGLLAIAAPLAGLFGRVQRLLLVGSLGLFVLHGLQYAFIESGSFVRAFTR